jgi:hypothetical protein
VTLVLEHDHDARGVDVVRLQILDGAHDAKIISHFESVVEDMFSPQFCFVMREID